MGRPRFAVVALVFVVAGAVVGAGATTFVSDDRTVAPPVNDDGPATTTPSDDTFASTNDTVAQFSSEAAFREYVRRGMALGHRDFAFDAGRPGDVAVERDGTATATPVATAEPVAETASGDAGGGDGGAGGAATPDRVSGTNVQVRGIDEPDILKNDGRQVFYAPRQRGHGRWEGNAGDETHVLSIEEPSRPEYVEEIDASGRLLLSGDRLVVIEEDELRGFDVSDPEDPEEVWTHELESAVVTARLANGTLYLVTRTGASPDQPCPIEPLGGAAPVDCTDVFHPRQPVPVDSTYTAIQFDPESGEVGETASFVGTSDNTAVYMSGGALYVTYTRPVDRGEMRVDFLLDEQAAMLPEWVERRLVEIRSYNLSSRATRMETEQVLQQWYRTLEDSKREVAMSNVRNDYRDYLRDHQRDLVRTGVVRVPVDNFTVSAVGTVPGRPLNQFSLDEHDGHLRVTTTIPAAGSAESANDLYVLDSESLDRVGAEQGMGLTERVYSVRYVGDTAYVVTFRRIDPFHVVDLSDPANPEEVGQLELPGFSSYLHPIDDDTVLGIGQEDGRVKAVTFDVSDPTDPTIEDDYVLDSGWSAVSESHHAFLLDRQHGVFFLPTGEGGNVVDYTGGDLSLETRVHTDGAALRAMYVDHYMYVFGQDELVVVDERSWERTETVEFD